VNGSLSLVCVPSTVLQHCEMVQSARQLHRRIWPKAMHILKRIGTMVLRFLLRSSLTASGGSDSSCDGLVVPFLSCGIP